MTKRTGDERKQAISQPKDTDSQWEKKVELAKQARAMGKSIRAGKPKSFRRSVGLWA
ncbi:hypothetical protein ACFV24_31130 [Nocardia fluminea]|uniref:hypothetical protein n=1 Tax=Nocardia fluminea TaxID=134984 RepID=UPI00366D2263